jgi:NADH-quinone oxidoreductase subunit C
MKAEEIGAFVNSRFGDAVIEVQGEAIDPWIRVEAGKIVEVLQMLRDGEGLKFDYLRSLAALDRGLEFEIVYHLYSLLHRHALVVKARVSRDTPVIPTAEGVYPAANWHEREAFDLMGIRFEGHGDLRRLFLPEDWEGHPLRKDYREKGDYRGISTRRDYSTGTPELPNQSGEGERS